MRKLTSSRCLPIRLLALLTLVCALCASIGCGPSAQQNANVPAGNANGSGNTNTTPPSPGPPTTPCLKSGSNNSVIPVEPGKPATIVIYYTEKNTGYVLTINNKPYSIPKNTKSAQFDTITVGPTQTELPITISDAPGSPSADYDVCVTRPRPNASGVPIAHVSFHGKTRVSGTGSGNTNTSSNTNTPVTITGIFTTPVGVTVFQQ